MSGGERVRADVIVVGSGPNGLAAALLCARAGRSAVATSRTNWNSWAIRRFMLFSRSFRPGSSCA